MWENTRDQKPKWLNAQPPRRARGFAEAASDDLGEQTADVDADIRLYCLMAVALFHRQRIGKLLLAAKF